MRFSLLSALIVITGLFLTSSQAASANTIYWAGGKGFTYQYAYSTACVWYDSDRAGTGAPCWQGVWSTTDLDDSSHLAKLYKAGLHHDFYCVGNGCSSNYSVIAPYPLEVYALDIATGAHYWPGNFGGSHKVNVVGYAWHADHDIAPSTWYYTEAFMFY